MDLKDLEKKYLISQLDFVSIESYLTDNCNNNWINSNVNEFDISIEYDLFNYFKSPPQLSLNKSMSCLCLKTQKQITSSIHNENKFILGEKSFTIDFWMNLTTEKYYRDNYSDIISQIELRWDYNKDLKIYNSLTISNYGFNLTYCNNKISTLEKRYKQLNGIIRKQISEENEDGSTIFKDTPIYFNPDITNSITDDSLTFHHLILSYNNQYSTNHPNHKNVLNVYIDGKNYIDKSQYKNIPIIRNPITVYFKNYNETSNNSLDLYISKFRIWDGVALEVSDSGDLIIFDENLNKNYFVPNKGSEYMTQYDGLLYMD